MWLKMTFLGNACCWFLVSPTLVTKNRNIAKYRIFVWFILSKFVFIKFSISNIFSDIVVFQHWHSVQRGISPPILFYPPLFRYPTPSPENVHPPLDPGLFHRCHSCSVISYTCFFFIYVYLLSCYYLPNWSPFNRIKPQSGGNYLHSAILMKKTPAFFILQY